MYCICIFSNKLDSNQETMFYYILIIFVELCMGRRFVTYWNSPNFLLDQQTVAKKWFFRTVFLIFKIKNWFHQILLFLGVGILCNCMGMFPVKEGVIQVLARLTLSTHKVRYLLRTPWWAKPIGKTCKKLVRWIHFNGKMNGTTFHRMHLAKSKF